MDGTTGFEINTRKTAFLNSYNEQEVVEANNRLRAEGTGHILKNMITLPPYR